MMVETVAAVRERDRQSAIEKSKGCLHHFVLCPFSRKIRLILHEKGVPFTLVNEPFWRTTATLTRLNPVSQVPVWVEENGFTVSDSSVIAEYLEESYPQQALFHPDNAYVRAETRRLVRYADERFWRDVTQPVIEEKVLKHWRNEVSDRQPPRSERLRVAARKLRRHLEYFTWLLERRAWLAGPERSVADFAFAAHISVLDYLNSMIWTDHSEIRTWYTRLKSRSSFRFVLDDFVPGHAPPKHYNDLDFQ